MKKAISYTLIFIGIQLLASVVMVAAMNLLKMDNKAYMQMGASALSAIVTIIIFVKLKWARPTMDFLATRPVIVMLWALLAACGTIIPSIAFHEQLPELPNIVEEEMSAIMNARGGYFIIAILVPFVEELVFRGAILRALLNRTGEKEGQEIQETVAKKDRHWLMITISALFFALVHMNPAQMPHAFLIGLLLGWMYYRTGSIVPGVVFHCMNNTISYILFKLYPDSDTKLIDILGSQRNVAAAVMFSLFILLPAIYQLHIWMKRPKTRV